MKGDPKGPVRGLLLVPAGYGHPLHRRVIAALMRQETTLLVDCRLTARSRWLAWSQPALRRCYGQRYVHIPAWGNRWYRERPRIEIVDLAAGVAQLQAVLVPTTEVIILLCGCAEARHCHRSHLAAQLPALLQPAGIEAVVTWPEWWAILQGLVARDG
jgi:hypothetical protein